MSAAPAEERLPAAAPLAAGVALTALVCALAPLQAYLISLAAFGLAHALAELRYLDARFGPGLRRGPARLAGALGALLVLAAGVRLAGLAGWGSGAARAGLELGLLALLGALALPALWRRGAARAALGAALLGALGVGLLGAPALTLLVLAWAHNLTPVAFLAERLRGAARRRALLASALAFGLVPLALLLGLPGRALGALGVAGWDEALLGAGPYELGVTAWLPAWAVGRAWARDALAAAACLQCLHYAAVLHVLPRLADPDRAAAPEQRPLLPWPARARFLGLLLLLGAPLLLWFWRDFARARAAYGVLAVVHAWVELPLLLLALGAPPRPSAAPDAPLEASLASSSTSPIGASS